MLKIHLCRRLCVPHFIELKNKAQGHLVWDEPNILIPESTFLPLYSMINSILCNFLYLFFGSGDTLLAIQAPSGTQLEVPIPEMVCRITFI